MLSRRKAVPEKPLGSPSNFARHVRDALTHIYDPAYLQSHSLTRFVRSESPARPPALGRALLQATVDAVEGLRPAVRVPRAQARRDRVHWHHAEPV
jgi:hypothetical protein